MNTARFKRKIRRGQHTPPAAGSVLTAADFTYAGSIFGNNNFAEGSLYSTGIGLRYVGGQLRFIIFAANENVNTGGKFVEFRFPPGGFGSNLASSDWTNSWLGDDVFNNFRANIDPQYPFNGFQAGMSYEDGRLWLSLGIDYSSQQTTLMTCGVFACELGSTSPGVVSNPHGLYGFEGVSGRCPSGTVRKNPSWFQSAYGVGSFMYGCGGGAFSLIGSGTPSWGLFLLAAPDITAQGYAQHFLDVNGVPNGYPDPGDGSDWTVPTSAFKILADHRSGTTATDWYDSYTGPGYVPPYDAGIYFANPGYLTWMTGGAEVPGFPGSGDNGLPGSGSMTTTNGSTTVTFSQPVTLPVTFTNPFHIWTPSVLLDGVTNWMPLTGPVTNDTIGTLINASVYPSGTGAWHHYDNPCPAGTPVPKSGSLGGQWLYPAPDGYGRMGTADLYRATGVWIDGPNKKGYITVANLVGGGVWYYKIGNSVNTITTVAEIHIFDPADLGAVALGTKNAWNVQPVDHLDITATLQTLGICTTSRQQTGSGPQGAAYDSVTKRLWVYSTNRDPDHDASGYGWALSCWEVNC